MRARAILTGLLCVGLAAPAAAQGVPAGTLLEQVDVTPLGDGARVSVRFGCPLRYTAHFPATALTELRVSLAAMPGCGAPAAAAGAMRAPAGNGAGLAAVRLEPGGAGLVLTLTFDAVVDVTVRSSPDLLGLEVAVVGGATVARAQSTRRTVAPAPPPTRTLPSPEVLDAQWAEARAAFDAGDYASAVRLLTRLVEYPEHPRRGQAQELLGLSRERAGQFAHAKAEYEEYLRRYPAGDGAGRVEQRLAALTTLDARPRVAAVARPQGGMDWTAFGGWLQEFRHDSTSIEAGDFSADFLSQSMVMTDGDFSLRGRGERFDVQARMNAGYLYDLLPDGPGDQTRVSMAYAEIGDRQLGLNARLGRQSRHTGGVLGTFDGLYVGWRALPSLRLNLMTGYPVESTRNSPSGERQFVSLSANWSGWLEGLEISPFLVSQTWEGVTDRQAIGGELRWYAPGRTVVGLLDYDLNYSVLNMAMLLGAFELPGRWTLTSSLDHRKSPFIATRNALAGQPVRSYGELRDLFEGSGVEALAEDRTASLDTLSVGVSRPLGTRFHWSADVSGTRMSSMRASGGVEAFPGTGTELGVGAQLIGNSLLRAGDVSILGLRWFDGGTARTLSLSISSRFPLWNGLRIGPRLRLDQRDYDRDGSKLWLASPSLRIDWNGRRSGIEFEAGGETSSRDRPGDVEKTDRYWFSLGYRMGF